MNSRGASRTKVIGLSSISGIDIGIDLGRTACGEVGFWDEFGECVDGVVTS